MTSTNEQHIIDFTHQIASNPIRKKISVSVKFSTKGAIIRDFRNTGRRRKISVQNQHQKLHTTSGDTNPHRRKLQQEADIVKLKQLSKIFKEQFCLHAASMCQYHFEFMGIHSTIMISCKKMMPKSLSKRAVVQQNDIKLMKNC